jgi:hypothetical protein
MFASTYDQKYLVSSKQHEIDLGKHNNLLRTLVYFLQQFFSDEQFFMS